MAQTATEDYVQFMEAANKDLEKLTDDQLRNLFEVVLYNYACCQDIRDCWKAITHDAPEKALKSLLIASLTTMRTLISVRNLESACEF